MNAEDRGLLDNALFTLKALHRSLYIANTRLTLSRNDDPVPALDHTTVKELQQAIRARLDEPVVSENRPFEGHTDKQLLGECFNALHDFIGFPGREECPKIRTLMAEIKRR